MLIYYNGIDIQGKNMQELRNKNIMSISLLNSKINYFGTIGI